MDDIVSIRINTAGACILAGCFSAVASVSSFTAIYSFWPKVSSGCFWPPGDTLFLGLPLSGVIGGGVAGTYILYQSFHTHAAIRFARCTSMVVLTLLFWHFLLLGPSFEAKAFERFSESFAEQLPMYLVLAIPAWLLLRWQHNTSRRLSQPPKVSPQYK